MNLDLHKVKSITFLVFTMFLVSVICPGILFVFTFGKNLFLTTDAFKLILLCISITTPVWLTNSFIIAFMDDDNQNNNLKEDERFQIFAILGSIFTIPVVYLPIAVKIFYDICLQVGVAISFATELIILILCFYLEIRHRNKKRKK